MLGQNAQMVMNGQLVNADMTPADPLARAVAISLFTWRRGKDGDTKPGEARYGWWGDGFSRDNATPSNARIGSRLWLLAREKLTQETLARAKDYAKEALQWLVTDGVASAVSVTAERNGLDRLDLWIVITRDNGSKLDLRFSDMWSRLNV